MIVLLLGAASALAQTPAADLAVTSITALPASPQIGNNFTYTITIRNNGPNQATGVVVTDMLPPQVSFVPGGSCSADSCGTTVTCPVGLLTGTTTVSFTVKAKVVGAALNVAAIAGNEFDSNLTNNSLPVTTTIVGCPTISVSPSSLPGGAVGTAYSQTVTASGGSSPYTFDISAGTLPTGLTLSSGGLVSGTPTTAGTFSFTVRATDAGSCTGVRAYSVTITCPTITLSPTSLPQGTATVAYNQTLTASPLVPYVFSVISGTLPGGLTLSSGGVLSGTPSAPGTFSFTVRATDAQGCLGSRGYTVVVLAAPSRFYGMAPCRVLDTRNAAGPYGAPALSGYMARSFTIAGQCGVPAGTTAIVANFTVVNATSQGSLVAYPSAVPVPLAGIVSYSGTLPIASLATILLDSNGAISVYPYQASGTTVDLILDISGYYK